MLWNAIKTSLHGAIPESEFGLWIKPLECRRHDDGVLELVGPDRFFCAWVEDRYLGLIRTKAAELGEITDVRLQAAATPPLRFESGKGGQLKLPGVTSAGPRLRSLHPAFTFEQFMVGESNLLARSACQALATGDATFGNCLFMNSTTGLGKSHLTQAVVHQVLRSAPSTRLHYLTAQQFSAEMVKGIRTNAMEQFSKKYINDCDMLLVEDVHTLTGKTKTQEELNTILDYLIKSGRRVILTSALPPTKLAGIDDDFRSRMTSGLVTGIESPDYETRARIIRHKLQMHGLGADEDLVGFMAESLQGDVRRMESAIIGIKAKSCLLGAPPDLGMVREVVYGLIGSRADITGEAIRELIGRQFRVSIEDLCSRSRKRSITFPRQLAMYLTRKYTTKSLADIGSLYNRDHSTVLYAIKTITKDMSQQTTVRQQVELLSAKLKN
ncbi:chromosomal replication initiator protein DnaA [Desulfobulbus propionicus DSM 2032]|jgi:chromosomal replication initiator protein|uniref:Chromosomal replication initiator protein DnaA n=1 Tax=Desulfobulbus propionicus (strain ATCC 33891 / DSM 2032 / VKM B-1956 / 1pr3) TaxID=577650 RepID=A0A7U3YK08_DESPD|nr:chromosomal replication initiator protein DnaA [Desulfobulbus propionicus]ADW16817.1 chromosomal replication initiator protein DnaA [Desulfobulbus propionicus DSM 2032]